MLPRSWLTALSLVVLPLEVVLAGEDLGHEPQVWLPVTAQAELIDETFGGYIEVQPRLDREGLDRLLVRPAVFGRITEEVSAWVGYAWTPGFDPPERLGTHEDEHRIWEQLLIELELGEGEAPSLSFRTRLEQRFLEDVPDVAIRVRQMVRFQVPVHEIVSLATWDEVFLNANDARRGPRAGYDQNRLFLGVNLAFSEEVKLDVGYLNVHSRGRGEDPDRMRHVLMVWLMFKF